MLYVSEYDVAYYNYVIKYSYQMGYGISRFQRLGSWYYANFCLYLFKIGLSLLFSGWARWLVKATFFHAPDTFQCIINPLTEHTDPGKHCVMVT